MIFNPVYGGASAPNLGTKTITQNGTYSAASDNLDGYSEVTANVPNTYAAADEGKVVNNGALVAQTSRSITTNGTYDTTLNDEVAVDVQPTLQAKTGIAITANGSSTYTPDAGYDGLSEVSGLVAVSGGGGATILNGGSDPTAAIGDDGDIYLKYTAAEVPEGYTQVAYLQSSGSQYINTGIVPNDVTAIDIVFELLATPAQWSCLFGSQGNYSSGANTLGATWTNSRFNFRWGSGSNQIGASSATALNTRYHYYGTDEVKFDVDDALQGSTSKGATNSDLNLYLFCNNIRGQGARQYVQAKIYSCTIYGANNTVLRHFVPALNGSNVAGMWETVTETFFTNSGSGTFSTGAAFEGGDITAAFAKVNGAWQALIGTNIDDINL